jgi:hypothetical protein
MHIGGGRTGTTIESDCNAMTTTTTTTKGADNHDKEDPLEGVKYPRRARARRGDWHLLRRYVARPSGLTSAMRRSCSWQR